MKSHLETLKDRIRRVPAQSETAQALAREIARLETKNRNTTPEIVLAALRQHAEGPRMPNKDGSVWADVYLDNAHGAAVRETGQFSIYTFRAALGKLAKQGLYKVVDGWAWGSVKMN